MTTPWLTVVGVGADGLAGLPAASRTAVDAAEILVGGERHLAMAPRDNRPRHVWPSPMTALLHEFPNWRGRAVCVLASGDPLWHGVAASLARHVDPSEMVILPHVSAFALACARMVWSQPDTESVPLHTAEPEALAAILRPGARIVALSRDGDTPAATAAVLDRHGYGAAVMHVFENLGAPDESRHSDTAQAMRGRRFGELNTMAIACPDRPEGRVPARVPGMPDTVFRHDGRLTKQHVRAATLAALRPQPRELLWDIGAGAGSVAIEWQRHARGCRAVAVEARADRCALAAENAHALGCPDLRIVHGNAPGALADLPAPDAVFLGGGLADPRMLDTAWRALGSGGRLVANAVTLEGEQRLMTWYAEMGGTLTRLQISHAENLGAYTGWRPQMPVTQYAATKA